MYKNLHSHLGDMGVQLTTRQMYLKFLSFIAIKYYLGGKSKFIYLISYFPKSLIQSSFYNCKGIFKRVLKRINLHVYIHKTYFKKKNPITTTNLWRKNSIWMLKGGIPFCLMIIIDNNKITLDQDLPPPPPNLLSKVPLKYADGEREGNPIMKEILLLILVQVPWFGIPYKSIHFL